MKREFSLLELLVVMAVISIILSLTLPALSAAMEKANEKSCMSNLRSISQGVSCYNVDYDDFCIPANFGDTSDGDYGHFINFMIAEMDYHHDVFICDSMAEDDMFDPAGHDPESGNIFKTASYIMNIVRPGKWSGANIPVKNSAHGWGTSSTVPVNNGVVTFPSQKLLIMDVMSGISNSHSGVNYFQRSDHGIINTPPTGLTRWIGNHHGYRFNAVFGDGHAESLFRSEDESWAVNR